MIDTKKEKERDELHRAIWAIADELRGNSKLEEFASVNDTLEETFENREQIEISKFYEKLPNPVLIAIQEYLDDQIYFRKPEKEEDDINA